MTPREEIENDDILQRAITIARISRALIRQPGGIWLPPGYDFLPVRRRNHYRVWTPSVYRLAELGIGQLSGQTTGPGGFPIATRFDLGPQA